VLRDSLESLLFLILFLFNQTTVAEMIEKLQKFPQDMEVQITDDELKTLSWRY
jgi:hypothetical protein